MKRKRSALGRPVAGAAAAWRSSMTRRDTLLAAFGTAAATAVGVQLGLALETGGKLTRFHFQGLTLYPIQPRA